MTGRSARSPRIFMMLLSAAILTSCSAMTFEPPELQRAQRDGDSLPSAVLQTAQVEADSTRFVAPWESAQVYLARSSQADLGTCLVVLEEDPEDWASSCLRSGGRLEMSVADHRYLLGESADAGSDEQWTELTEGVYVLS